jgi:hypothetical protein
LKLKFHLTNAIIIFYIATAPPPASWQSNFKEHKTPSGGAR